MNKYIVNAEIEADSNEEAMLIASTLPRSFDPFEGRRQSERGLRSFSIRRTDPLINGREWQITFETEKP